MVAASTRTPRSSKKSLVSPSSAAKSSNLSKTKASDSPAAKKTPLKNQRGSMKNANTPTDQITPMKTPKKSPKITRSMKKNRNEEEKTPLKDPEVTAKVTNQTPQKNASRKSKDLSNFKTPTNSLNKQGENHESSKKAKKERNRMKSLDKMEEIMVELEKEKTKETPNKSVTIKLNDQNEIDDLNDKNALIIKGLHFKVTASDLKKKCPNSKFIRLPSDIKDSSKNKGFAILYYDSIEECDKALEELRMDNKILGRMCFASKYRSVQDSSIASKQSKKVREEREVDRKKLYVTGFVPRQINDNMLIEIFPKASFILLVRGRSSERESFMKVHFESEEEASKYFDRKDIKIENRVLTLKYAYKNHPAPLKRSSVDVKGPKTSHDCGNLKKQMKVEVGEESSSSTEELEVSQDNEEVMDANASNMSQESSDEESEGIESEEMSEEEDDSSYEDSD